MYENNTASDLTKTGQRKLEKAADKFTDQAHNVQSNLVETGKNVMKTAEQYYEDARSMLSEAIDTSVTYAKKNPIKTVAGAAVVGYILGLVSRRR